MIGTIQSFDATNQTATIALNYKKWISATVTSPSKIEEYPLLVKCPVVILSGGINSFTVPITKGDSCLVLFCDREIDTWFTSGGTNAPQSARVHDLNDGIALVGIRNIGGAIKDYSMDGLRMKAPYFKAEGISEMNDACDGSFISLDGKVVTVARGLVVSIL
jgi:hypothetical protein